MDLTDRLIYPLILIALYVLRIFLHSKVKNRLLSAAVFCISITAFYLIIVLRYEYGCCDLPPARWIGAPFTYLLIPTISFYLHLFLFKKKSLKYHIIESVIEFISVILLWTPLWIALHFVFGWAYI